MPSKEVLNALEGLHRELEKLEPALKHVETAQEVTNSVRSIPDKHVELIDLLKNDNKSYKESLSALFSTKLAGLSTETEKLIASTREIHQQVEAEQQNMAKLKEEISISHQKIERINFPERLDKLDATVSGIMAAVQSTQSRLDNIERNLSDKINEISQSQRESFRSLASAISSATNRLSIFQYLTWILILALAIAFFVR